MQTVVDWIIYFWQKWAAKESQRSKLPETRAIYTTSHFRSLKSPSFTYDHSFWPRTIHNGIFIFHPVRIWNFHIRTHYSKVLPLFGCLKSIFRFWLRLKFQNENQSVTGSFYMSVIQVLQHYLMTLMTLKRWKQLSFNDVSACYNCTILIVIFLHNGLSYMIYNVNIWYGLYHIVHMIKSIWYGQYHTASQMCVGDRNVLVTSMGWWWPIYHIESHHRNNFATNILKLSWP